MSGAVAVVIEHRLAAIDAVLPGRDARARLTLGPVQHRLHRCMRDVAAELPASASSRRSPTCAEPIMAARSPRKSRGWRTLVASIRSTSSRSDAGVVEAQRRDADALLPDFGRAPALYPPWVAPPMSL